MVSLLNSVSFTICSINYLAQAITLGNSIKASNPEMLFRIYLVDKFLGREEIKSRVSFPIIEIEKVPVTDFSGMCVRYNIIELNTAVKPFIIEHILRTEKNVQNVIYFDPDIMVFGSLGELFQNLTTNTLVLTPHTLSPSEGHPFGSPERNYLVAGIFNLGFIGVSRQEETFNFLKWWQDRLIHQSYGNNEIHLFYDQKWLNLSIIFFKNVFIEKSPGYNMAGWNLFEREVTSKANNKYMINYKHELIFYHFSGVKIHSENISDFSGYSFKERPDLVDIIKSYRENVLQNGNQFFSSYRCFYSKLYKGMTIYYPKYHWITIYRRTRVNLGRLRRIVYSKKW
jgi:lipopolysaccharide biosynthesis glycosyltransferase